MQILPTSIADVLLLEPAVFGDERGYFLESYNRRTLLEAGIACDFVQDSASYSRAGVLRGLHYQKGRFAQSKLVRVVSGRIFDVALDIRPDSSSFGQWTGTILSGENNRQLFIPKGFAHGFIVLSEAAHVAYKTDAYWAPQSEGAIDALDAQLAIDWGIPPEQCIRSPKDQAAGSWAQYLGNLDFVGKEAL